MIFLARIYFYTNSNTFMLVEPYIHKNIHLQCTPQNMHKSSYH